MRILLTGATGFVGSHLARRVCETGHELIVLKRPSSDCRRIADLLPRIRTFNWEPSAPKVIFQNHPDIQAIIHTATCYGRHGEGASELLEANTLAPIRLMEAASEHGVRVFINTDTFFNSGQSLYAHLSGYTLTKRHLVDWGRHLAIPLKIVFANLKLFHVYGPQDGPEKFVSQIMASCLRNVSEIPLTAGEQKRDFVFVQDVVEAYIQVLRWAENAASGFAEFEVGTGREYSIREFVEAVHRLTRSRANLNFGALPYRGNEFQFSPAQTKRLAELGWCPQWSLEAGLTETLQAVREISTGGAS